MPSSPKYILDLELRELEELLAGWSEAPYRARQIFDWMYKKAVWDFQKMENLPRDLRHRLTESFFLAPLKVSSRASSLDETRRYLLELDDGQCIEAVAIPASGRLTFCISTQVGCRFRCKFCASGQAGLKRNLTTSEIIRQVLTVRDELSSSPTHLVCMGIGEPLDNYAAVLKAIRLCNAPYGLGIGSRRLTISSAGVIPGIRQLCEEEFPIELSVSLHAAEDTLRTFLMPINRLFPLKDLLPACRDYWRRTKRVVSFEYILIGGLNTDKVSARRLVEALRGMDCKVNLMVYNEVKGADFKPPTKLEVFFFRQFLHSHGVKVTLRASRGRDIQAACGQLRLNHV